MISRSGLLLLSGILWAQLGIANAGGGSVKDARHREVSMRMIGHEVLLALGDSTSRVLPIESEGDQYRIRFESEFGFEPEALQTTIDSVIQLSNIAESYIVEFVTCDSSRVVHSYEIGGNSGADLIACRSREVPVGCYNLLITLINEEIAESEATDVREEEDSTFLGIVSQRSIIGILLVLVILVVLVTILLKRRTKTTIDSNMVRIGEFLFDMRNMELLIKEERITLTSKEADLLQLLSSSANDTVERDDILKNVWGDEGDYIGRTLDVFISKLRKKLEADSKVKIINIRGVGYKLVMND